MALIDKSGFRSRGFVLGLAVVVSVSTAALASVADFKSPLDDSPMTFEPTAGETESEILIRFKKTGENGYRGDAAAIADGKKLYTTNCVVCHGADAKGKMGPALIGEKVVYPQVKTDAGMFSVVYGGGRGAMQSFRKRGMKQDDMLKIVTYVRSLEK